MLYNNTTQHNTTCNKTKYNKTNNNDWLYNGHVIMIDIQHIIIQNNKTNEHNIK